MWRGAGCSLKVLGCGLFWVAGERARGHDARVLMVCGDRIDRTVHVAARRSGAVAHGGGRTDESTADALDGIHADVH